MGQKTVCIIRSYVSSSSVIIIFQEMDKKVRGSGRRDLKGIQELSGKLANALTLYNTMYRNCKTASNNRGHSSYILMSVGRDKRKKDLSYKY